jgi:hypothetical protein
MCAIASTTCFLTFFFFGSAIIFFAASGRSNFAANRRSYYRLIGRFGPLRVRAFVRVRWPRSGNPRR